VTGRFDFVVSYESPTPLIERRGVFLLPCVAAQVFRCPVIRRNAILRGVLLTLIGPLLVGCERPGPIEFVSSEKVLALSPALQAQIRQILDKECGTPAQPRLLGDGSVATDHLLEGQNVYMQRCAQCHGMTGDGNGEAAKWLYPRPRDYRAGKFKFTSTPFDYRPLSSDLVRTVRSGIPGTSMPAFNLLPAREIGAVVDYILALTRRGELELQLASEAEGTDEALPEETIADLKGVVLERWNEARSSAVNLLSSEPVFTAEKVAAGKQAFLTRGCSKCHGEDGRGQTVDNLRGDLKDAWGHVTRAADLTSGLLHGGHRADDIYRRIFNGTTGTPMPSFQSALAGEPETIWNLVGYVLYVANRRRAGEMPAAGMLSLPEVSTGAKTAGLDVNEE
jgi:mono/diheme cytochrome c family protein